jgi:hypothetical protein
VDAASPLEAAAAALLASPQARALAPEDAAALASARRSGDFGAR